MDTTEGIHKPAGKYLFNWINFNELDPLVQKLKDANYRWLTNPTDSTGTLVCLPVKFENVQFDTREVNREDGSIEVLEVTDESALTQLERYRKIQTHYCDQNVSNTIYYTPNEKEKIVNWLLEHWDVYVGVSFLFKNDPTVSATDLGFNYLPQEYVTKDKYEEYIKEILEINFDNTDSFEELEEDECAGGVCPVK